MSKLETSPASKPAARPSIVFAAIDIELAGEKINDRHEFEVLSGTGQGFDPRSGEVGAQGLRLQFRADHENPRFVALQPSGSEVQVILDPVHVQQQIQQQIQQ